MRGAGEYKDNVCDGNGVFRHVDGMVRPWMRTQATLGSHSDYMLYSASTTRQPRNELTRPCMQPQVYDGHWKKGERNGRGVLRSTEGHRFEGEFRDGDTYRPSRSMHYRCMNQ